MVVGVCRSCILSVTDFDVVAQRRPIADKAVNRHMAIVVLIPRVGGPGAAQSDTSMRFREPWYG